MSYSMPKPFQYNSGVSNPRCMGLSENPGVSKLEPILETCSCTDWSKNEIINAEDDDGFPTHQFYKLLEREKQLKRRIEENKRNKQACMEMLQEANDRIRYVSQKPNHVEDDGFFNRFEDRRRKSQQVQNDLRLVISSLDSKSYTQTKSQNCACRQCNNTVQTMTHEDLQRNIEISTTESFAMGDNEEIGNPYNSQEDTLEGLARRISKSLLEIEECHNCNGRLSNDLRETVIGIKTLLDLIHKLKAKRQVSLSVSSIKLSQSKYDLKITQSTTTSRVDVTIPNNVCSTCTIASETQFISAVQSVITLSQTSSTNLEFKTCPPSRTTIKEEEALPKPNRTIERSKSLISSIKTVSLTKLKETQSAPICPGSSSLTNIKLGPQEPTDWRCSGVCREGEEAEIKKIEGFVSSEESPERGEEVPGLIFEEKKSEEHKKLQEEVEDLCQCLLAAKKRREIELKEGPNEVITVVVEEKIEEEEEEEEGENAVSEKYQKHKEEYIITVEGLEEEEEEKKEEKDEEGYEETITGRYSNAQEVTDVERYLIIVEEKKEEVEEEITVTEHKKTEEESEYERKAEDIEEYIIIVEEKGNEVDETLNTEHYNIEEENEDPFEIDKEVQREVREMEEYTITVEESQKEVEEIHNTNINVIEDEESEEETEDTSSSLITILEEDEEGQKETIMMEEKVKEEYDTKLTVTEYKEIEEESAHSLKEFERTQTRNEEESMETLKEPKKEENIVGEVSAKHEDTVRTLEESQQPKEIEETTNIDILTNKHIIKASITKSGNLEVVTEADDTIVESIITYSDSGTVNIATEIIDKDFNELDMDSSNTIHIVVPTHETNLNSSPGSSFLSNATFFHKTPDGTSEETGYPGISVSESVTGTSIAIESGSDEWLSEETEELTTVIEIQEPRTEELQTDIRIEVEILDNGIEEAIKIEEEVKIEESEEDVYVEDASELVAEPQLPEAPAPLVMEPEEIKIEEEVKIEESEEDVSKLVAEPQLPEAPAPLVMEPKEIHDDSEIFEVPAAIPEALPVLDSQTMEYKEESDVFEIAESEEESDLEEILSALQYIECEESTILENQVVRSISGELRKTTTKQPIGIKIFTTTTQSRSESIDETPFTIKDTKRSDLRKQVEEALEQANKVVIDTLMQSHANITEALEKFHKDMESVLALSVKKTPSKANKQVATEEDLLDSIPKGSRHKKVRLEDSRTTQSEQDEQEEKPEDQDQEEDEYGKNLQRTYSWPLDKSTGVDYWGGLYEQTTERDIARIPVFATKALRSTQFACNDVCGRKCRKSLEESNKQKKESKEYSGEESDQETMFIHSTQWQEFIEERNRSEEEYERHLQTGLTERVLLEKTQSFEEVYNNMEAEFSLTDTDGIVVTSFVSSLVIAEEESKETIVSEETSQSVVPETVAKEEQEVIAETPLSLLPELKNEETSEKDLDVQERTVPLPKLILEEKEEEETESIVTINPEKEMETQSKAMVREVKQTEVLVQEEKIIEESPSKTNLGKNQPRIFTDNTEPRKSEECTIGRRSRDRTPRQSFQKEEKKLSIKISPLPKKEGSFQTVETRRRPKSSSNEKTEERSSRRSSRRSTTSKSPEEKSKRSEPKEGKSKSLQQVPREETYDHKALVHSFERPKEKIKKVSRLGNPNDCTCLPGCGCLACSLFTPNVKVFGEPKPSGDAKNEEARKRIEEFYNEIQQKHPEDCECVDCLCDPEAQHPEIFCSCGLGKKPKQACLCEQSVVTETLQTSTMSYMVSDSQTLLTESATKKISIIQIPYSSNEESKNADIEVISLIQDSTNCECLKTTTSKTLESLEHPGKCLEESVCLIPTKDTDEDTGIKNEEHQEEKQGNAMETNATIKESLPPQDNPTMMENIQQESISPKDLTIGEECNKQIIINLQELIKRAGCICRNAEDNSLYGTPLEQSFVAVQKSSFRLTLSGLKLALQALQDKCKQKDHLIATMASELRLRTNTEELFGGLEEETIIDNVIDYDRTAICKALPRPGKEEVLLNEIINPSVNSGSSTYSMCYAIPPEKEFGSDPENPKSLQKPSPEDSISNSIHELFIFNPSPQNQSQSQTIKQPIIEIFNKITQSVPLCSCLDRANSKKRLRSKNLNPSEIPPCSKHAKKIKIEKKTPKRPKELKIEPPRIHFGSQAIKCFLASKDLNKDGKLFKTQSKNNSCTCSKRKCACGERKEKRTGNKPTPAISSKFPKHIDIKSVQESEITLIERTLGWPKFGTSYLNPKIWK